MNDVEWHASDRRARDQFEDGRESAAFALLDGLWRAPIGIAVLGPSLEVLQVNPEFARLTGLPAEAHVGRSARELFPGQPGLAGAAERRLRDVLETGQPALDGTATSRAPGGAVRTWAARLYPIRAPGGAVRGVCALVDEVTHLLEGELELARARAAAARSARRLALLQELTSALSAAAGPEEVWAAVVDRVPTAASADGVGLYTSVDGRLDPIASRGLAGPGAEADTAPRSPSGDALGDAQGVWLTSLDTLAARYPALVEPSRRRGGAAWAALPLRARGRTLGVLTLAYATPQSFDLEDRAYLLSVADQVARALGRVREVAADREAEEYRRHLLAIVGHDIRTPLTSLALSASLLGREPGVTSGRSAIVHRILRAVARIRGLADALVDFAHARTASGIPLHRARCDAAALCRSVALECEGAHPGRQVLCAGEGDTSVQWDADRVGQALVNVVGNALDYSPVASPVELRWAARRDEVEIAVRNAGPPIPPDVLPRVFEPFRRGRVDQSRGLGLGLFIARAIVVAHGGEIGIRSDASATEVRLRLPRGTG